MKSMDCTAFVNSEPLIRSYLGSFCKLSRVGHSLSVAATASALCERFGQNRDRGRIAGLAHDILKDKPLAMQWEYARKAEGISSLGGVAEVVSRIDGEAGFADKIIHGPAASVFLFEECGLGDIDMLEAIALHSSASERMSPLSKILYIADKMEPGRSYIGSGDSEELAFADLDMLLAKALGLSIGWLKGKDHAIAQSTLDLYNALTMRIKEK